MNKTFLIALIIMTASSGYVLSQSVVFDSTFSNDGIVMHTVGTINDEIRAIVLQPDGKIVAAGLSYQVNPTMICALSRYLSNGVLDTSFSSDGTLTDSYGQLSCSYQSVALQQDGKIVAVGFARDSITFKDNIGVARYNSDGTNDSTFGIAGKITTDFYSEGDGAFAVALQPDGKIVAAGGTGDTLFNNYMAIVRYASNGDLDTTFNNDGKFDIHFATNASASSMAVQTDGKFVIAGAVAINNNLSNIAITRVNTDGILDSTFGIGGKQTISTSISMAAKGVAIQTDGKIVIAGFAIVNAPYYDFVIIRLLTDGTIDSTFSNDGIEITSLGPFLDYAHTLIIQQDGKIIVAGAYSISGLQNDFALARYNINGTLDSTFGINGILITPISTGYETIYSLQLQPDGKLLAGGFADAAGQRQFALVRFTSDLALGIIDFEQTCNSILMYPNPIDEQATLNYELKVDERVSIELLDLNGEISACFLENENQSAGKHSLSVFLGNEISSGCYILRLSNGAGQIAVKVIKR